MPAKEAQDGSGDIVEQQAAHIVRITNHVFWERELSQQRQRIHCHVRV